MNQVFYVIKYLEFAVMWYCIRQATILTPTNWNVNPQFAQMPKSLGCPLGLVK